MVGGTRIVPDGTVLDRLLYRYYCIVLFAFISLSLIYLVRFVCEDCAYGGEMMFSISLRMLCVLNKIREVETVCYRSMVVSRPFFNARVQLITNIYMQPSPIQTNKSAKKSIFKLILLNF